MREVEADCIRSSDTGAVDRRVQPGVSDNLFDSDPPPWVGDEAAGHQVVCHGRDVGLDLDPADLGVRRVWKGRLSSEDDG
jgi:hypothetical protein